MSKEFFVQGKEYSSRMNEEGIHYYNNTPYPIPFTQYPLPNTHYPIPFTKILTGLSTLKTRINEKCKRNCKRKVWANCQSV